MTANNTETNNKKNEIRANSFNNGMTSENLILKVKEEIHKFLLADETNLGQVYKHIKNNGWDINEIDSNKKKELAKVLGNKETTQITQIIKKLIYIQNNKLPSDSYLECVLRTLNRITINNKEGFSKETLEYLRRLKENLESKWEEVKDVIDEKKIENIRIETVKKLKINQEGIYVYTLPHYYINPIEKNEDEDEDLADKTFFKIGHSSNDVIKRFNEQKRETVIPEDPILLRIYGSKNGEDSKELEAQYHKLIDGADHRRSRGKKAGKEWFLTSLKYLDTITEALSLEILFKYQDEVNDKEEYI